MNCAVREFCGNNGEKCWLCKADNNGELLFYKKNSPSAPEHPINVEAKKNRKEKKIQDKKELSDKKSKDKIGKVYDEQKERLKLAAKREDNTNKSLQKLAAEQFARKSVRSSDGNSGRLDRNDDHAVLGGEIMYDTKSYSKKVHPPIDLDEYDTCRAKAMRHNANCYGQVCYNKNGRSFMIMDMELDWCYIQEKLNLTIIDISNDNL